MMKHKLLGLGAAALMACATTGTANAVPYGFAEETYNDFRITLTNATLNNGSVSVTTNQNYPGTTNTGGTTVATFGSDNAGPGGTGGAVNAPNAFSGGTTGSTYNLVSPGDATTNQAPIGESSLKGGIGAQAATSVGGASIFSGLGDGSYMVVENGGRLPFGALGATASQTENLFTFTTGGVAGNVTFNAEVQAFVEAMTTLPGETASGQATAQITENLCDTTSFDGHCNNPLTVGSFSAVNIGQTSGPTVGDFTQGDPSVFIPLIASFDLVANRTYQFSLLAQVSETTSSPKPAPEPASLAVLGTGLVGLAGFVRRWRRKN
jgi:hypothetical protein